MSTITCPVCTKRFESEKSNSLPFCSERCRTIDLKRWLGEEYSMPAREQEPDEDEGSSIDDSSD